MALDLGNLSTEQSKGLNVNLTKGFSVDLRKDGVNLHNITLAAGWDVAQVNPPFDLDLFAFCYHNNAIQTKEDIIFFNNKKVPGIELPKDNQTGAGEGDDEKINFQLDKVDTTVTRIKVFLNIFEAEKRNQNFSAIKNAYVRIINNDSNKEEIRFNLTQDYSLHTAIVIGDLVRKDNGWELVTIGQGEVGSVNEMLEKYQAV